MKKTLALTLICLFLLSYSCTTAEIPLEQDPDPIPTTVTYVSDVKTIIDNNCISCHGAVSPNAGLSLVTYQQVKNSAQNGNLIARMNDQVNPMPQGQILSVNIRAIIDKWRDDGFLEN